MRTGAVQGSLADQGRLLREDVFSFWSYKKDQQRSIRDLRFKSHSRHVLLYEGLVVFCKKKDETSTPNSTYTLKNSLPITSCGLTESLKGDKRKFELWSSDRSETFTLQAGSVEVKNAWVSDIRRLLLRQTDAVKDKLVEADISSNGTIAQRHDNTAAPAVAAAAADDDDDDDDGDMFMTSSQPQSNISASVVDLQQVFASLLASVNW